MLTISKPLTTSQAKEYYENEYAGASENYYTQGAEARGEWRGQLAAEWNLRGEVTDAQYELLCDGRHPETGEQLVNHVEAKTYLNRYGKEITASEHRAGWDATFSAPKSVSLASIVGGDARLLEAHRQSVDAALAELERYTQARIGGNHPAQMTGKFAAATFEHTAARPDGMSNYAAPQLHTHAVIFNITETEDGRVKPVQPLEMYRSQKYATAVYRAHLAEHLQRLGYEIEVDARTGAPEIAGFSREYLAANSPRSAEVRRMAAEICR